MIFARACGMAQRDVIVVGASSGGVQALMTMVEGLPENLPAAVFVVVHTRPDAPSHLPTILNRAGALPAAHAVDEEPVRRGRIYIAPPGMQTYLQRGRIAVRRGPHENDHRPSVDALFRTAAHHYGPRVIGVVLSGALDDGTAGLLAIKRAGGTTLVQDPHDAAFPAMPANAIEAVEPDFILATNDLAPMLVELAATEVDTPQLPSEVPLETAEEAPRSEDAKRSDELGAASQFVCPACSGTLYEINDGRILRFRCRVGHAYSADSLEAANGNGTERALWAALRALEERSALLKKLADYARRRNHGTLAAMYEERAGRMERDVRAIHDLITTGPALDTVEQDGL
jgi:two-component system, chemotaxis family, protein-glutamate methylesterase/glutaminase